LSQTELKEFEWYLRDHLFRNQNKAISTFELNSLPQTMIDTYLRYRNADLDQILVLLNSSVENLVSRNVLKHNKDSVESTGKISRMRCAQCLYICYVSENEPTSCFRCYSSELHTFPKKKE